MNVFYPLAEKFNGPAETPAQKFAVALEALRDKRDFYVFDGTQNTAAANTTNFSFVAGLIGNNPGATYSLKLNRATGHQPEAGDRVTLAGTDGKQRLFLLFAVGGERGIPQSLRAVGMETAEYKGGYGWNGEWAGEEMRFAGKVSARPQLAS